MCVGGVSGFQPFDQTLFDQVNGEVRIERLDSVDRLLDGQLLAVAPDDLALFRIDLVALQSGVNK